MEGNYKKLFKYLTEIEPNTGLENRILEKISQAEEKRIRTKMWTFGARSVAAFGLVVAMGTYLHLAFTQSGFYQYLSLLFSRDLSITYWKEISFSILESTPLLGVMALMAAFAIFVWSTTNTLKLNT